MRLRVSKTPTIIFLLCCVILITSISYLRYSKCPPFYFVVFLILNFSAYLFLLRRNLSSSYRIDFEIGQLSEKINLLVAQNIREQKAAKALNNKISHYRRLKEITEALSQCLNLEQAAQLLADEAFKLISAGRGNCLLFLVDERTQNLSLFKTKKENEQVVIKTKEGDIFDHWVLRHSSPLIVEDVRRDFRFDPDKIKSQENRRLLSLISSPLISNNSLIGLLRLELPEAGVFSQDDLRLLSVLGDLGAVAIENSQLFQRTQDLAIHDDLTGLYRRTYFIDRLSDEAKRCLRLEKPLSLLMVDIDFFKRYNDKFGHTAGDIVLKKLSLLMQALFKEQAPLICRFGGEEFLILLSGMDKENAYKAADALRSKIAREKITLRRQDTEVSVSIGVSCLPRDTKSEDELIQHADKAMYKAKAMGRNRVCCV